MKSIIIFMALASSCFGGNAVQTESDAMGDSLYAQFVDAYSSGNFDKAKNLVGMQFGHAKWAKSDDELEYVGSNNGRARYYSTRLTGQRFAGDYKNFDPTTYSSTPCQADIVAYLTTTTQMQFSSAQLHLLQSRCDEHEAAVQEHLDNGGQYLDNLCEAVRERAGLKEQMAQEIAVEKASGGVADLDERRRIGAQLVSNKAEVDKWTRAYKRLTGKAPNTKVCFQDSGR